MYHWNIPDEGIEGTIEHQISGKVLGLTNNGTGAEVIWQTKDESISVSQKWLRVISTGYIFQGCFTLVNSLSKMVLTASEEHKLTITGTYSMYSSFPDHCRVNG